MTIHLGKEPFVAAKIVQLVLEERTKALSVREWKHRLAGYGYSIKETEAGQIVTDLFGRKELCLLPEELTA